MSWVLLSLGVYTFVYCMVLLFLENFSGGTLFGMDKQVIAALIGASVSVAAILGSIIKDRISEKGEHDGLSKEHVALKEQINNKHDALKEQINNKHDALGKQINNEHNALEKQINNEHNALEKQLSAAQTRLDHLHDESIRMEGFRKDVEKQGIDVTAIKSNIDALVQKNGENITQIRDLTRDLEKSEQKLERFEEELADVRRELQYYKEELDQSQRENQQLKQQIYNLQHPQQSWDEPER